MRYLKVAAVAALVLLMAAAVFADNCPACGADVDPGAETCPACGFKIEKEETTGQDAAAAAKKLYEETVAAVKRSQDHSGNLKMIETSKAKLAGTEWAAKLDPLFAEEQKAAKAQADAAQAAFEARMAAKREYGAVVATTRKSRDYAANVAKIEALIPKLEGTPEQAQARSLLAEQKKLLKQKMDTASAREKAERQKYFKTLGKQVRRERDPKVAMKLIEDGLVKLQGTKFEAQLSQMAADTKKAIEAAAAAGRENAGKEAYNSARSKVRTVKSSTEKLELLEAAAAKMKGTRYEGKLDSMIAATKKAMETETASVAEAERLAAERRKSYDEVVAAVGASEDHKANITSLQKVARSLRGTEYEEKLLAMVDVHKRLLTEKRAKPEPTTGPAATTEMSAGEKAAKKLYDYLARKVKTSKDHAANMKSLEEGLTDLAGTPYEPRLKRLLATEKRLAERATAASDADAKAQAEAAKREAQRLYNSVRSKVRRSRDRAANVKMLEEAIAKLAGTDLDGKLDSTLAAEKAALAKETVAAKADADAKAKADAEAKAKADAEAQARADADRKAGDEKKLFDSTVAAVKASEDYAANIASLEKAAGTLKGTAYERKLTGMVADQRKQLDRKQKAMAAADAAAAREASKKLYNDLRAKVRASSDHAANIGALEDGLKKLTGTTYEKTVKKMLETEKKAAERALAAAKTEEAAKARAEAEAKARADAEAKRKAEAEAAAAKKAAENIYNSVRGKVRRSKDRAGNVKSLEEALTKLKGTAYETKVAGMLDSEKKLLAREAASAAEDADAKAKAEAEAKLRAEAEAAQKAKEEAEAKARAETEAKARADARTATAAQKKLFDQAVGLVKISDDHSANIVTLETAATALKGSTFEAKLTAMIAGERKAIEDAKTQAAAAEAAEAAAAVKRTFDSLSAKVRASEDHTANIAALEDGLKKLAGTDYERRVNRLLDGEKRALTRAVAAAGAADKKRAEAAAKKAYESALSGIRRSKDHVANLKTLEAAAAKLVGTRYEGRLESQIDAEKAAVEKAVADAEVKAQAEAAAKKLSADVLAQVKASQDYNANIKALESAIKRLAGTAHLASLDRELGAQKSARAIAMRAEHERIYKNTLAMVRKSDKHDENARLLRRAAEKLGGSRWESKLKSMAADEAAKHEQILALKKREVEEAQAREKAAAEQEQEVQTAKTKQENAPEALMRKAKGFGRSDPDAAIAAYQTVMRLKDTKGRYHPLAKEAAYAIAEIYAGQRKREFEPREATNLRSPNNWSLAARYFHAAAKLDSTKMSDGTYRAGQLYLKLGQRKKARLYFERAAEATRNPKIHKLALRAASQITD